MNTLTLMMTTNVLMTIAALIEGLFTMKFQHLLMMLALL
jgi:uncharacterized membrane protein SpoIIM required for sporulation